MLVNYTDSICKCESAVALTGETKLLRLYKDGTKQVLTAKDGCVTVTLEAGNCAFIV